MPKFSQDQPMNQNTTQKKGLKGKIVLFGIRLIGALPLSIARALGAGIGRCSWLLQDRSSKITQKNLAMCYPDMSPDERQKLAKESVKETGRLAAEICVIQQRSKAWLDKKILTVTGESIIKEEIAKGKGLILLAPHLGNWEVLSLVLPTYGKLTALYQPPKQAYLEEMIINARQKTGATLVPTDRRGVVQLLKSLKGGGITAVLPDQNPAEGSGEFSPFFGIPAYTMTLVHGFVQRSDCAVVYGFVKRVRGGFEIHYLPAPDALYSHDVKESVTGLNQGVENCIAHCPAQYQWEYKRFKVKPEAKDSRYLY